MMGSRGKRQPNSGTTDRVEFERDYECLEPRCLSLRPRLAGIKSTSGLAVRHIDHDYRTSYAFR